MSVEHKLASFVIDWVAGIVGAVATAIGLWMYHGPVDGVLQLFWWEFDVAQLAVAWPLGITIAGALSMTWALTAVSRRLSMDGVSTRANVAMSGAVASFALAVVYALIWII
jgi:hypothetical protein